MHNVFISQHFDWATPPLSTRARLANRVLAAFRSRVRLGAPPWVGGMTNVEQRMNMCLLVEQVLTYRVAGDLVEVGCHDGKSATLFQSYIEHIAPDRTLHVFDSFQGLPEPGEEDGTTPIFGSGQLPATEQALLDNFAEVGLNAPVIHRGWFSDTLPTGLPERICFAHLDGDYYDSIRESLEYVYPLLSSGAVCLIDDYSDPAIYDNWNGLPGVKKACDEFLGDKPEEVSVLYSGYFSHGFFRKR